MKFIPPVFRVLIVLFALSFTHIASAQVIPYGSFWKYSDNGSVPSSQNGNNWTSTNYDDNAWSEGQAHLGYGDGDENTVINNSIITAYFRKTFTLNNPSQSTVSNFTLVYDDGAIVYINGVEVARVNMPGGLANYNTFASSGSSDNANYAFQVDGSLFNNGENVVAIEVHQRTATSSDISFDLRYDVVNVQDASNYITRGPYLQKATSESMVIRWRTLEPSISKVNYGINANNLNFTETNNTATTEHELEITGLSANTLYHYEIENGESDNVNLSTGLTFKTYPTIGTNAPLRAWVLGDCGTGNNNQRNVRDAYNNLTGTQHTDMMLFLGDNAYVDGTDDEYQYAIFEDMYEEQMKNTVSWSCLGNHDGHSADSDSQTGPYYDIFTFPKSGEAGGMASGTEAYYSFDYGKIHFIVLDSYETNKSIGGTMYNWCQNDIENTLADWIVAFWHHPPYTKGSHDSDTENALVDMRSRFLPMLEANGVDLVLSGHSHSYERSYYLNGHYGLSNTFNSATHTVGDTGSRNGKDDGQGCYEKEEDKGTVYVTAGSSGKAGAGGGALDHPAMYYSMADLGSCLLEINGSELTLNFVRDNGAIEDYFTIKKNKGLEQVFSLKTFLGGNYDAATNLMTDNLRTKNYIPLLDPYLNTTTVDGNVFDLSGGNAIVDWVSVEFRSVDNPADILQTKAYLIQRDGDVVDVNGSDLLVAPDLNSSYYLAVRHRNHLGTMTAGPVDFTGSPVLDFSNPQFATWGNQSQNNLNGVNVMWSGNVTADDKIIFQGANNDPNDIFFGVLTDQDNTTTSVNFTQKGYYKTDVNLDGDVIYQGPGNDQNTIFFNVLQHPSNTSVSTNYTITEQLP